MLKKVLLAVIIGIIACTVGWTAAKTISPEPDGWQKIDLKVEKVLSARDGDAVFHGYLAKWKDQDVVVRDDLLKTDYHVGDTIPVVMFKNKYPGGKPGPDLLVFMVADY